MILTVPVRRIVGHGNALIDHDTTSTTSILIAGEKATQVKTINTDEVSFKYPLNSRDSRASLSYVEADEEIADILTAADLTASPYDRSSESINVLDVSGGTTTATVFPWADFRFAIAGPATGESYAWFAEGNGKIKEYLVDHTLAELVTLATP